MFLFGRNKLKVRSEEDEDGVNTFVNYSGIKQKDIFKVKVLNELMGDDFCLGILDSKLLSFKTQEEFPISIAEIIEHLDFTRVAYKKIETKKIPEVSVWGVTIKKGAKKTDKDYIIGFVINKDNLKKIDEYVNKLNLYYFIDKTGLDEEALLQKFEENYEDVDEMRKDFYCQIFNNNYIDQFVVLSGSEPAAEVKEIANKCYSEL
ncbi:hypothetical protein CLPUN_28310 [Clostridium puniceum]|uniref:Uncharacterized protein n=1 Tax=Clostridium puniceum TaxID=29367 RepID=A0A1S8TE64_9CLOT|nr:hypothetical protein [Clostridium puniceum]OOM76107.1 hypothetical protein CLPUN_28310 [Clostridium puniceum]